MKRGGWRAGRRVCFTHRRRSGPVFTLTFRSIRRARGRPERETFPTRSRPGSLLLRRPEQRLQLSALHKQRVVLFFSLSFHLFLFHRGAPWFPNSQQQRPHLRSQLRLYAVTSCTLPQPFKLTLNHPCFPVDRVAELLVAQCFASVNHHVLKKASIASSSPSPFGVGAKLPGRERRRAQTQGGDAEPEPGGGDNRGRSDALRATRPHVAPHFE